MNPLARFALDAPVLPLVTETLPLAEQARRALLWWCHRLEASADLSQAAPAFWGKDQAGRPLSGHRHAFFLPVDEDRDGRLDHLIVYAPRTFSLLELRALDRLRSLAFGEHGRLQLLRVGLGRVEDFRTALLGPARVWQSATPFVVTRHPKRRGRKRDAPAIGTAPPRLLAWSSARSWPAAPTSPPPPTFNIKPPSAPRSCGRCSSAGPAARPATTASAAPPPASGSPSPSQSAARSAWATAATSASACSSQLTNRR